jgi:hypothetical protein
LKDEVWEQRLQKRRSIVQIHKEREEYRVFAATRPRLLRQEGEPMTPCTQERASKRQWETSIQRWRESLRDWPQTNGARFSDQVEDIDESEPPLIVEPSPSGSAALCPTTGEAYLADLALLWLAGDVEGGFGERCLF